MARLTMQQALSPVVQPMKERQAHLNQRFMASCQRECTAQGLRLMGCMWLADIKYDWEPPLMPIRAGTRYALTYCCCSYKELPSSADARREWNGARDRLRKKWSDVFGDWPTNKDGEHWPGHHMRDLKHGGNPVDLGNIFPTPRDIHDVFGKQYPMCYAGSAPWNTVGPDLPYRD